jgi:hypothetical protein
MGEDYQSEEEAEVQQPIQSEEPEPKAEGEPAEGDVAQPESMESRMREYNKLLKRYE